ncbi:capsule biosynthesis protein [Mesobacterium pallidum]|uniref:capsule biosynthesis protein n=1 Tax=Mesobacterium pallidum TaxID=2872037 RepID=UPI001EE219CA|nr:capsule biosynthesis protein [Mesobacterium pallidum]
MTTKPKARKFRIKRSTPPEGSSAAAAAQSMTPKPAVPQDGTPRPAQPAPRPVSPEPAPKPGEAPKPSKSFTSPAMAFGGGGTPIGSLQYGQVASADEARADKSIDAIRQEGLTGRQLRMARRVAQKHGLPATSDFDAVRLLREKGIDPFQRATTLELVVGRSEAEGGGKEPPSSGNQLVKPAEEPARLPQTVPQGGNKNLPSTEQVSPAERRARDIMQIQQDIAQRRRRKMVLLMTRLAFFVGLPTILAGWYFYVMATPMYATNSEFLIIKNESAGSAMSGLFSGTQFATNQDAIAVQSYLESKDAMLRLDQDVGFKSHFTQDFIDPIQRLAEDPTNEQAYKLYKRNITIGYDPTEGVVKMEVTAADPVVAAEFSRALITYAEERVDNLSFRMRENAVQDAQDQLDLAQSQRRDAQETLVRLQQEGSILDPEGRIAALRSQINNVEVQLQEKQLTLQALLDNARPSSARVDGARGDIRRLEALLAQLNSEMTSANSGENSLAQLAANIAMAESDLANADLMLQSALDQLQGARREANAQSRYLTTSVQPVASEDPSYPRKFENTLLAFLIFSGIYLMISLTASILREQVAS